MGRKGDWNGPESYAFCFCGIPEGSVVAISSQSIRDAEACHLFFEGFKEMVERIRPSVVLCYRGLPVWVISAFRDQRLELPRIVNYPARWQEKWGKPRKRAEQLRIAV